MNVRQFLRRVWPACGRNSGAGCAEIAVWLETGYNLARLWYEILFSPEALEDLRRLSRVDATAVVGAVELHLRHAPEMVSRSRIKRLRELTSPQYRLRVDEWRIFYDVAGAEVLIRGVMKKPDAAAWLAEFGESS